MTARNTETKVLPVEITEIKGVNLDSATSKFAVEALNNEVTTFQQVVSLFTRVCKYDRPTAEGYTQKIHFEGRAVCFWGSEENCKDVITEFGKIGVKANLLKA